MKAKQFRLHGYKPEHQNSAQVQLGSDFQIPGVNTDRVFWSSRETGFASYVLVTAVVSPGTFKESYFTLPDGRKVRLVSVNGCGDERWAVNNSQFIRGADKEAKDYFHLS